MGEELGAWQHGMTGTFSQDMATDQCSPAATNNSLMASKYVPGNNKPAQKA